MRMHVLTACICLLPFSGASGASATDPSTRVAEYFQDPEFRQRFAESYLAVSDVEPEADADEVVELQPVLELLGKDDLAGAAQLLEARRANGSSALVDFMLGNVYFQQEDYERAVVLYDSAVGKFSKFRRAWQNLGLILVRQGEYEKAVEAFTKVIELGGANESIYGLLGYSYGNLGANLAAESAYRMAILLKPDRPDWQMGLARTLFRQERFADAASLFTQLIGQEPNKSELWLLQANAYIGMGMPMRAAQNYEIVDQLGGSTNESLNMLGDIYVNAELFDVAADAYVRAIPLAESPRKAIRAAKVLVSRSAYEDTSRLSDAIMDHYGQLLTGEQQKDLLKIHAKVAVAEGRGEDEVAVLERIIKIDPLDGEAIILLGQYHARNGNLEQAVFLYERAQGIEKSEADACVRHAQVLVQQRKYRKAVALLERAQARSNREHVQRFLDQVKKYAQASTGA